MSTGRVMPVTNPEELAAAAQSLLQVRGLAVAAACAERASAFVDLPRDTVMAAASACADEADFWRRLSVDSPGTVP